MTITFETITRMSREDRVALAIDEMRAIAEAEQFSARASDEDTTLRQGDASHAVRIDSTGKVLERYEFSKLNQEMRENPVDFKHRKKV